jgi:hypothetical protein
MYSVIRRDLEIDAMQALTTFAGPYTDGPHSNADMHRALIELTARALLATAGMVHLSDPGCPNCPICIALDQINRRAHKINGDRSTRVEH